MFKYINLLINSKIIHNNNSNIYFLVKKSKFLDYSINNLLILLSNRNSNTLVNIKLCNFVYSYYVIFLYFIFSLILLSKLLKSHGCFYLSKKINILFLIYIGSIFFISLNNLNLFILVKLNFLKNFFSYNLDIMPTYLFLYNLFICYSCIFYSHKIKNNSNLNILFISLFSILIFVSLLFLTNNMFIFFLLYESILLPSAIVCYVSSPNIRAKNITYYFIFWTQCGSFLFFFSIIYLFYKNITFFNNYDIYKKNFFLSIIFFFGFGVKVPVWPFHFWLTKTHVEVNTSFSIFLSGILVKIALIGVYKFYFILEDLNFLYYFILFVGIIDITVKIANQVDFKKIVAYCTIFEMNTILLSFIFYNYNTLIFYFIFCMLHTILSNMFFLLNDYIYKRFCTRNLYNINSLFLSSPNLGILLLFSVILFNGIPFTLKFYIEFSFFLKIFNFDLVSFFIFYLIQTLFYILFSKLNYSVIFQYVNYHTVSDLSFYELFIFFFSTSVLILIFLLKKYFYYFLNIFFVLKNTSYINFFFKKKLKKIFINNNKIKFSKNYNFKYTNYVNSFFKSYLTSIFFENTFGINYIRDNNKYSKSQYSKARAFCKNIVNFSLVLNIIVINELHSIYYNVQINYGYMIYILYITLIVISINLLFKM